MSCCSKSKRRSPWIVVLLLISGAIIVASASVARGQPAVKDDAAAITNTTCPVTLGEAIDPDQWVEYQGRHVYFCCQRCKRKFEREPVAYVGNLPINSLVSAASQEAVPVSTTPEARSHDGHAHGNSGHSEAGDGHLGDGKTTGGDEAKHDHASHGHGEASSFIPRLIGWFGRFHPPSVNFPIALMTAALVAELLFMATGRPLFDAAGRFTVWFAILGTLGAVTLGWFFAGFKLTDGDWMMTTHRWVGTAAGLWAFVLAWFACKRWPASESKPASWPGGYRIVLVIAVMLVSANGFLGGALIYGLDHYAW